MGHKIIKIPSAGYITASQVGTLYGCGFGTKLGLYNRFKGVFQDEETFSEDAKRSMEFGKQFEDAVAQFFMYKTGLKVKKVGKGEMAYWSDDMPYFICHPDRIGIGPDKKGRRFALEIKCVGQYSEGWGDEWTDQVPDHYYLQVQSYFACKVPCDVVYMAVLKGNRVYFYEVLPDEEVTADIRNRVAEAKAEFDADIVPEPVNYDESSKLYRQKVNMEADGIGANDEVMEKYNRLLEIHEQQETLTADENKLKQELMKSLGEAPAYVTTEGKKIKKIAYWSNGANSSIDEVALKKDFPKLVLDNYKVKTTYKKFNIGYPKKKKEDA